MFKGTKNYHNVYRSLTETKSSIMTTTTTGAAWDGTGWVREDQGYQSYNHRPNYHHQQQQQQQHRQQNQSNQQANYNQRQHRPRPLPSSDLPKIPPHITPVLDPNTAPTSDLVTYYSTIYQHYAQRVQALAASGDSSNSNEHQWAEYYADLSTRAAHHYNDLLQEEQKEEQVTAQAQVQAQEQQQRQQQGGGGSGRGAPPASFQEYAHRNLSRCVSDTQKSAMTELIQMTIKRAVQDGSMFSRNWEMESLLPLPMSSSSPSSSSNMNGHDNGHNHNHHSTTSYSSSQHQSSPSYNSSSKGKSKSQSQHQSQHSYLDAVKGKNRNKSGRAESGSGKRKSPDSLNSPHKRTRNTSHGNDHGYDDLLPQNDSYYGAPSRTTSNDSGSNYNNNYDDYNNNKYNKNTTLNGSRRNSSVKDNYDDTLPTNDSYYGRRGSSGGGGGSVDDRSSPSQNARNHCAAVAAKATGTKERSNEYCGVTKARAPPSPTPSSASSHRDFQFGDYISLSSLSKDKYVKKKNKLVKAASLTLSTASSSSLDASSSKKKKSNILKSAKSSKSKLASRLSRFSGEGGIQDATSSTLHSEYSRGIDKYMGKTVIGGTRGNSKKTLDEDDYENMTVRGSCQVLEKEYLRLTAPPKAELVRPHSVLEKHLKNLQKQWKGHRGGDKVKENNSSSTSKKRDYNWFCSQLKAIRQDLTVQRIFNAFAVEVYETHARIALEEGDLNEYNQSQTKLKELYEILSHKIDDESLSKGLKNQNEFIAYRIIYYIFLTGNKKYDGGSSDLFKIMLSLSPEQRQDPCIAHALKVRVAVADNDYHAFFRLQDTCPNIGAYLMDMMIGQVRATGLQCMMKAYRPSLSVEFILNELGFNINGELDADSGLLWLKNCGCKLNGDETMVLTKETILNDSELLGKKNSSLI